MFNFLFTFGIFVTVAVLIVFIIKTLFQTSFIKQSCSVSLHKLEENIVLEQVKLQHNQEKVALVEEAHKTLFNRFFKITTDIILLQKLIFELYTK